MAVNTKATTMMYTIIMTIRIAMTAIDMTMMMMMMMMMMMLIMMITSLIAVSFRNDFMFYSVPYFSSGNNLST